MNKAGDYSISKPEETTASRDPTTRHAVNARAKARSTPKRKRRRNLRRARRESSQSRKRKKRCRKRRKSFPDAGKSILTLQISLKAKQSKMISPRKPVTMSGKSMLKKKRVPFHLLRILRRPLRCKEEENDLKVPLEVR